MSDTEPPPEDPPPDEPLPDPVPQPQASDVVLSMATDLQAENERLRAELESARSRIVALEQQLAHQPTNDLLTALNATTERNGWLEVGIRVAQGRLEEVLRRREAMVKAEMIENVEAAHHVIEEHSKRR